jgi:secreted PhoX family phosphatase
MTSIDRNHEDDEGRVVNPTDNPTFASVLTRREMLRGTGAALVLIAANSLRRLPEAEAQVASGFTAVGASNADRVIVPAGYRHSVLLRWGDPIFPSAPEFDPTAQTAAKQALQFGYDNDFIGFMPLPMGSGSSSRGLLGVNHENARELMWPGWDGKRESKTQEMVETEIAAHGFTVVEIARAADGQWSVVKASPYNRRITGATPMAIRGPAVGHVLMRTKADPAGVQVLGTLNNCAGGVTPWGTVLTGEENIQIYFRGKLDVVQDAGLQALHKRYGIGTDRGRYITWGRDHDRFDLAKEPNEPNRFGWVVEIDPYDAGSTPVKHTALGRMAHEGATVIMAKDGRPVVYMGDDARFEYLYKFVAARRVDPQNRRANLGLLDSGTLYVARFRDDGTGEWLPLVHGQGPLTEANGLRSQAEVVIGARRAADLVGATKMDRPEDVEPNWRTGKVYAVRRQVRSHHRADRGRRRSDGGTVPVGDVHSCW